MKQTEPETIVQFLSFSIDHCGQHLNAIERFSPHRWERILQWLDDAGLAFYFFQKIKGVQATDAIPDSILGRLQKNLEANQLRVEDMSHRFAGINKKFHDAGIRYAAVKGFSLVPEFCQHAALRHQGDFDYLVDDTSLPAACRVLLEAGYISKDSPSSVEKIFVVPEGKPSRSAEQYSPRAPHAVELHTDMWDGERHHLPQIPNLFFLDRAVSKHWNGLTFPALCDEDAFVLQILHACQHLFTLWIRMSNLFEIGYFLNRRADDAEFWNRAAQRIESPTLREFVVIVAELVSKLFTAPLPLCIQAWAEKIRPASRVWIEHYARRCAFSQLPGYQFSLFPTVKCVLFLHQQFREDASVGKSVMRKRLLPSSRILRMASSLKKDPSLALTPTWWGHHMLIRRSIFHLLSGFRYLLEVPRWRWRNRNKVPPITTSASNQKMRTLLPPREEGGQGRP
jgi:hypothetical protein